MKLYNLSLPNKVNFNNASLSDSRDLNVYIVYFRVDEEHQAISPKIWRTFDRSNITSFEFSDSACGDSAMSFGGIITKTLKFSFFDTANYSFENKKRYNETFCFQLWWTPNHAAVKSYVDANYNGDITNYLLQHYGQHDTDHYLLNLGRFYLNNFRREQNIDTLECVDCIGYLKGVTYKYDGGYASDPNNPTVQYVVDEIATLAGFNWKYYNFGGGVKINHGTLKLKNAADWNGNTCYDVMMEICKSCQGFCKEVAGDTLYDMAFSFVYGGQTLNHATVPSWSGSDTFEMNIPYNDVFLAKTATTASAFAGAQYLGNGYTYGSQPYITVDSNAPWDREINLQNTENAKRLQTEALLQYCAYPMWNGQVYRPARFETVSAPYYESLDIFTIETAVGDKKSIMATSVVMSGIDKMTVVFAGETDPQQNYITGGNKITSNSLKNTAQINALNRVFDVGNLSLGIGTTAVTSNIPVNGRVDSNMDFHFNNRVYLGDNQLKYITHQALVSSAQLSSAGWYRIASWNIGASTTASGATGILVNVAVATQYQGSNNSLHKISLIGVYNKISFIDETSTSNTNGITKIRYMTSTSGNGAIDVYYSLNTANLVRVDLEPYFARGFVAEDFTAVLPSPSDENEAASYTFSDSAQSGIIVTTESVTTSSGGYVSFSSAYPPTQYFILSATTTKADAFVRLTGSSSGQWIRVMSSSGSAVASETITVKLAMLKLS